MTENRINFPCCRLIILGQSTCYLEFPWLDMKSTEKALKIIHFEHCIGTGDWSKSSRLLLDPVIKKCMCATMLRWVMIFHATFRPNSFFNVVSRFYFYFDCQPTQSDVAGRVKTEWWWLSLISDSAANTASPKAGTGKRSLGDAG